MGNALGDLISKGEGDYNSYNKGTAVINGKSKIVGATEAIDFSEMQISEIMRRQALASGDPDRLFAVGKSQVIPKTMLMTVGDLKFDVSEKYTPENQEKMFADHLIRIKRPDIYNYIISADGATLHDAQKAACLEWASVEDPDNPGHAYALYERHGNRMHTTAAEIGVALDTMRAQYKSSLQNGLLPEEAWRHVTVGDLAPTKWQGIPFTVPDPRPLALGHRNSDTRALQENLSKLGITDAHGRALVADGDYGRSTQEAVINFQRQQALAPTGTADVATLSALRARINLSDPIREIRQFQPSGQRDDWMQTDERGLPNYLHAAAEKPRRDDPQLTRGALADGALKIGERGPEVAKLQESLIQLGINDHVKQPIKADGVFGPDTQRAVQAFQLWHGIDQVNGIADRQTMAAINTQAGLAIIQRTTDQVQGVPARDFVANVGIAARIDPEAAANPRDVGYTPASVVAPAPVQAAPLTPKAEPVAPAAGPTTAPGRSEPTVDAVRLSPSDQAMFAKIRGNVSTDVPDEAVAAAMLAAKRNGIPDAESIGPVGVANGTLWVSAHTPGFHTGVSVTAPAPPMQDTLRETQSFNQQRDQQLSQEAAQRGQDDPNRGPRM